MSNLFSIFDPSSLAGLPLNWVSALLGLTVVTPIAFWVAPSQPRSSVSLTFSTLFSEFKALLGVLSPPGSLFVMISAFLLVWMNNFLGLAPYIFTATSHLSFTLALALPLWIGHVSLAWIKNTQNMFAHLVPLGSPAPLSPFMVLIELVSAVIRPVTLAVRLAANMVAGHLLMVLLSSPAASATLPLLSLILVALVLLALLESAVATIQAYVFSILSVLYVNEVNGPLMLNL